MSQQMQKCAADLLSELENVLCPIVSTPLFCFQAATRAEDTISSICHLANLNLSGLDFPLLINEALAAERHHTGTGS